MTRKKQLVQIEETTRETKDMATGKITESTSDRRILSRYPVEPPYVKVYLDTILHLSSVPGRVNKVLYALLAYAPYMSVIGKTSRKHFAINQYIKQDIADELKLDLSSIDKSISVLVDKEILKRVGRGTFILNPHLIAKGEWPAIEKLRLEISFSPDGTLIQSFKKRKNRENWESQGQQPTIEDFINEEPAAANG
jgi:hypothetical protein